MFAVQLVLALCVVSCVRPARAHTGEAPPDTDRGTSQCDDTLEIKVTNYWDDELLYSSRRNKNNDKLTIEYESTINVMCGGLPAARLALTKDGEKLLTENKNDEVWLFEEKLYFQKSVYICSDVKSGCQRPLVILSEPILEVTSSGALYGTSWMTYTRRAVEYGASVSVSCTSSDASRLVLTEDGKEVITQKESENTITYFHDRLDVLASQYVCTDVDTSVSTSVAVRQVPSLYVQSQNETIIGRKSADRESCLIEQTLDITYDDSIEIICCGSRNVKFISPEEDNTDIIKVNDTALKLVVKKITKYSSSFSCVINEVPDCSSTLEVKAMPRMDAMSPNLRHVAKQYVVKYGDTVNILCSWFNTDNFTMFQYDKYGRKIDLRYLKVNTTHIRSDNVNIFHDHFSVLCGKYRKMQAFDVRVQPVAVGFRCVSHNGRFMNCSWRASGDDTTYTLSVIENADLTSICLKEHLIMPNELRFCTWGEHFGEVIPLLIQSCSDLGCFNETFRIGHASILRLAAPEGLRVYRTSSREAELHWHYQYVQIGGKHLNSYTGDILYKVVYWYSGISPREVNASLVLCYFDRSEVHLSLPCPGTFYEVKVYQRLRTSVGEEFWSDPSTVTFTTDEDINRADVDATCFLKPQKNKEVMKYFVQELKEEVRLDMSQLKKEVASLKVKLERIRTLREQLVEN